MKCHSSNYDNADNLPVIVAITQLIYVWVLVTGALSLAPMFPLLGMEFHLGQQQLSLLTGLNVITLGFANLFIVPLSNIFGRRPVSIVFGVLVFLTSIWQALATSHKSLLAARACNGIAAATSESIMVQVIADMFFLHERGLWMGIYFTMYFMGAFLGPIMSGNIAAQSVHPLEPNSELLTVFCSHGWRSFFWLSTALSAFSTVLLVFAFPETKFHRAAGHVSGSATPAEEQQADKHLGVPLTKEREAPSSEAASDQEKSEQERSSTQVGKGRPSKGQFLPFQKADSRWKQFLVRDIVTPVRVFFNPYVTKSA